MNFHRPPEARSGSTQVGDDLTCQSRDCVRAAASRSLERWGRPDWRRSCVGSSRASERRKVPPERTAGSCLPTAAASVAAESAATERVIFVDTDLRDLRRYHLVLELESPPEYLCAAGRSVLPPPPV